MLPIITPLPLTLQSTPFSDQEWLFELKYDGFRSLAYIEESTCRLVSRKGNIYQRFKDLSKALSGLQSETILDGELVCVDDNGLPQFYDLMFGRAPAHFYAFDILMLDGEDLRDKPCVERKQLLKSLVGSDTPRLHFVDHLDGEGEQLFNLICERDMEGIVAKPMASPYRELHGETPWIKIKNPDYSQAEGRGDLFHPGTPTAEDT